MIGRVLDRLEGLVGLLLLAGVGDVAALVVFG